MPPRQRLVRREPLKDRILSAINPYDFFLSLATEYEGYDTEQVQRVVGFPVGIALNVLCFMATAGSSKEGWIDDEEVLRRPSGRGSGFGRTRWGNLCYVASWILMTTSLVNAIYCFSRRKYYRMFEQNINLNPTTPSARRVPVDSSPASSPFKLFTNIIEPFFPSEPDEPSAEVDASPAADHATPDVWQLAVWDPTPLALQLFTYFSPVHAMVYWLSLPLDSSTTSPIKTYFTVIATVFILTVQTQYLQRAFTQRSKDQTVLHREVLHEYDAKFVHPRLNVPRRDVGTSTDEGGYADAYAPVLSRGFTTNPNPAYRDYLNQETPRYNRTLKDDPFDVKSPPVNRRLRFPVTPRKERDRSASPTKRSVSVSSAASSSADTPGRASYLDFQSLSYTSGREAPSTSSRRDSAVGSDYSSYTNGSANLRGSTRTRESYGGSGLRDSTGRRESGLSGSSTLRGSMARRSLAGGAPPGFGGSEGRAEIDRTPRRRAY